ncbi:protein adenylyltransferase SelO family protein [Soonwooa sp.]|uniref:protein adenylyltransferase SelO n=1 Tax=Soonwooa sp. TaxID=1938592 RepID=UPI00289DA187|nr:YdiU family protein [Soonwooa sp.]
MNIKNITHNFVDSFPGDFSGDLHQRQTPGFIFAKVLPAEFNKIELIAFNEELSQEIGLGNLNQDLDFLAAQNLPETIETYATAYAGHQFGNWAGQLGDGRAIFAGEIKNENNQSFELQWKGVGATPYSRFADGRAVLRSSVREFLMSEAMFHLGVPTTRALSLVKTGELVTRDIAYDGHSKQEQGAAVLRVAESFLRFGHFELLAARKEFDTLQKLIDFAIENYFDEVDSHSETKNLDFFKAIADRTAKMIIEWYRVGFVHGVMNTDNMSILGLTIDYGPYSMMDEYDLEFTPNTTDLPGKRYAFGKQAQIAHWNLLQLANSLFPVIKDEKALQTILEDYASNFWKLHDEMLCKKFGFDALLKNDDQFFTTWQQMMQDLKLDYTLFFNVLTDKILEENLDAQKFISTFYSVPKTEDLERINLFLQSYQERLSQNKFSKAEAQQLMLKNNPQFILRNYLLYEAIQDLENDDQTKFDILLKALKNPYQKVDESLNQKRPQKYNMIYGCSQLSCSS